MALFPTNAARVQTFAVALYGVQVGTTTMSQVTADIAAAGGLNNALNNYYAASFGTATTASVATSIVANVGLGTDANAIAFVTAQLNAAAPAARGAAVIAMLDNFLNTTTGTYAAAATTFNTKVTTAISYTGASDVVAGSTVAVSGQNFQLTTGTDNVTGTSAADTFFGTVDFAGGTNSSAASTLNAGDNIDGGAGVNTLNLTLQNANGASIGAGAAAVAQVVTVTPPAGTTAHWINFNYGGVTGSYMATGTAATTTAALANALNVAAGSVIAVAGATTVVITAPVAGVPLPALGFQAGLSAVSADLPSVALTTANVSGSNGVDLANTKNVQIYNINNNSGSALTMSAAQVPNITDFNADRNISALTVTNLPKGANIGVNGDGVTTEGAFTASYVSSATTAGTLNVTNGANSGLVTWTVPSVLTSVTVNSTGGAQAASGGQTNTITGLTLPNSVTTLNINAATTFKTGPITDTGLTTVNVSGAATTVTLNATNATTNATVTTIDGSGLTAGGLSVVLNTAVTSVKGGAGADTITTGATTAAGAVIDAGAGAADILDLAATNDVTTAAKAAQYQNFEILRNTTTGSVEASLVSGITSVQANASGAGFTKLSAGQAANVLVRVAGGTDASPTFALTDSSGSSDVLGLTLNNSTTNTGAVTAESVTGATINGFETLNVTSTSGSSTSHSALTFTSARELTKLNVLGAAPLDVTTTNLPNATTIDASGNTFSPAAGTFALTIVGDLIKSSTVTGTAQADSITTTAAITGSTGDFVVYNAGAGNDTISTTLAAINNTSAANGSVKVDGGAGTDTLVLTDVAGITAVDNNFQFVTGIEVISDTVANQAVSITSGGFFDSNFKVNGVTITAGDATNAQGNTINLGTFTGNATVSLTATAATTGVQAITTGSGNDVVTLLAAGTTSAAHTISTGAGNDTLNVTIAGATVTTGTVTINAGAGQDTINVTGNSTANADLASNVVITVNDGQSAVTAPDTVTGWVLDTATQVASSLSFDGTEAVQANVSSTASSIAGINYSVTSGLVAFSGNAANSLTWTQKATIVQSAITTADAVVVFTDGSDSYVFHNGPTSDANDTLVKLVGVTALGAETAATVIGYVLI